MTILHSPWLRAAVFLVSALILPAAGCGDDSDDESVSDAGAGTGGTSGSGGKGGAGGKGGKGGTGGSSGKGGAGGKGGSGATTLTCGGATCTPNSTLAMIAAGTKACCTSTDKCGQTNSDGECKEQNAPGELDEACPTVDVDFMGMNYPQEGCCTPSGRISITSVFALASPSLTAVTSASW